MKQIINGFGFLAMTALALSAAGCQTVRQDDASWREGWREAKVLNPGPNDQLSKSAWIDCRKEQLGEAAQRRRYAEVEFHDMSAHRRAVIGVEADSALQIGSRVLVNIRDCNKNVRALLPDNK